MIKYNTMKWVLQYGAFSFMLFMVTSPGFAQTENDKTGGQGAMLPPGMVPPSTKSANTPQTFTPSEIDKKEAPVTPKLMPKESQTLDNTDNKPTVEIQNDEVNIAEIVVQVGHLKPITAAAFSADSRFVLSGSSDATLILWDVATGKEIRSFKGMKEEINSIAVSSDGMYVLTGDAGYNENVRLWEIATGKMIRSFNGFGNRINTVGISPDGQLVIAGSDKQIKIWKLESGEEVYTLDGHTGDVECLAVSNNNKFLISGGNDKLIKVWDLTSGKNLRTFTGHTDGIFSLALSPNGKFVISVAHNDLARMWDLASGTQSKEFDCNGAMDVSISPDGKNVAFGGFETIQIWDIQKGEKINELKGHKDGWVRSIAYSSDGYNLISGGEDRRLKLWNCITGKENWSSGGFSQQVTSLAVNTSGDKLLIGNESGSLNIWDLSNGQQIKTIKNTMGIQAVAIDATGTKIFAGGWDFKEHSAGCKQWDLASGNLLTTYKSEGGSWAQSLAVTDDGKRMVWTSGSKLFFSDILSGQNLKTLEDLHQSEIKRLSSHGKFVLSCDVSGSQILDIETGEVLKTFEGFRGVLSNDGKNVLLIGYNERNGNPKVLLWEIATKLEINNPSTERNKNVKTMAYFISSVALSPDQKFALWSVNNELRLWNIEVGKEIFTLTGHTNQVTASGFFANGKFAYSGSLDASVRLWNLETGKEMAKLYNFTDGEWVILTAENYFNTSASGINYLCARNADATYDISNVQSSFLNPTIVRNTLHGNETLIDQKLVDILDQINPEATPGMALAPHFGLGLIEIIVLIIVFMSILVFIYIRRR